MSKSRQISIYLLKEDITMCNIRNKVLKESPELEEMPTPALSVEAKLYIADPPPTPPWWKDYLKINDEDLRQSMKGAILFLHVEERIFAITFGNMYHKLSDNSFVYDFGLLVTMATVDSNALKGTDVVLPTNAIRQRIQVPKDTDLAHFNCDWSTTVIKKIIGKIQDVNSDLGSNMTGTNNVRITTKKSCSELPELCKNLYEIYKDCSNKNLFPELSNIRKVNDPDILVKLDSSLVDALRSQSPEILLAIPEIADYEKIAQIKYEKRKNATCYDNVEIETFYEYLRDKISSLELEDIKTKYKIFLLDNNRDSIFKKNYSIYNSLIWDYIDPKDGVQFHFCDGIWYRIEDEFLKMLENDLDPVFIPYNLPDYQRETEENYNQNVANSNNKIICLDRENIAPRDKVEPCDLYTVENGQAHYIHVKIGTRSSSLSHLFNQGLVSIDLLCTEEQAQEKLRNLITEKIADNNLEDYTKPIGTRNAKVIFAIATNKNPEKKSRILPLFSRISLRCVITALKLRNVEYGVTIIHDSRRKK